MAGSHIPGPPRRFRNGRKQTKTTACVLVKSGPILTGYFRTKPPSQAARRSKRLPPSADGLFGDILSTHMRGLTDAVSGALHASPSAGPEQRLESVTKAWLDFVAAKPEEHRMFMVCGGTLKEPHRSQVRAGYLQALDVIRDAISAVLPGLGDLIDGLLGPTTAMLNATATRQKPMGQWARQREARRVSSMLIGITEISGGWNRLLPVDKPESSKSTVPLPTIPSRRR
jgi:hypothetical protein